MKIANKFMYGIILINSFKLANFVIFLYNPQTIYLN